MACCQGYPFVEGGERVFDVDTSRISYGSGAIGELGANARALGMQRVAVFTDSTVAGLPRFATAKAALDAAGCELVVYARARVEPTNESFADAIAFAQETRATATFRSAEGARSMPRCCTAYLPTRSSPREIAFPAGVTDPAGAP